MDLTQCPDCSAIAAEGSIDELSGLVPDAVGCIWDLQQRHGPAVVFGSAPHWSGMIVSHPAFARQIFQQPESFGIINRFPGPKNTAQRRVGRGMFGLNGAEAQLHRRLLMPPFRKEALPGYHDAIVGLVEHLLTRWQPGRHIDVVHEMKEFTLKMAARLLFGVDDLELAHAIAAAFEEWLDLNHAVSMTAMLGMETPPGYYPRLLSAAEHMEAQLKELVRRRQQLPLSGDVLSCLLEARAAGSIGEVELVAQAEALFNAAYHTTTYALTWSLFLLVQHPEYLRQVYRELGGLLGGRAPTSAQLAQLPLLERGIKESLRLMPPVVYLPRVTLQPVTLAGRALPQQAVVLVSTYGTHRQEEFYPRPLCFDPDRWTNSGLSPYAYIAFGGGHRLCLGAPFSQMLVKIALAMILQRYRLQVVPGAVIDRQGTLTLGAKYGVPMTVLPQDGRFAASAVQGDIHEMVQLPSSEGELSPVF